MTRRTLRNLGILAVLLGLAGWWIYAASLVASEEAGNSVGSSVAEASKPDTAVSEPAPDVAVESVPAGNQNTDSPDAATGPGTFAAPVPAPADDSAGAASGVPSVAATPAPSPRPSAPKRSIADVLEGVDLSISGERERVVAEMRVIEEEQQAAAIARAKELGLPLRREMPNGGVQEVAALDAYGQVLYRTTHNLSAAISTAANLIQAAPYSLNGSGVLVGVWDGGAVRASHQEFGGRVTVRDGAGLNAHATHVAGTVAAAGISNNARGMATAALVDSYDWNDVQSEMTASAAVAATETNKVLISNHSWGYIGGWNYVSGGSPFRVWEWHGQGTGTTSVDGRFGLYDINARDWDALAHASPYFAIFKSSGNDRNNDPAEGSSVALSPGSATVVSYNSSIHPKGDGLYRNGYDTITLNGVSKNVITIGAVNDAVSGGQRSTNNATLTSFSSWGPTDDGRIKPDLVANGHELYSTVSSGDAAYQQAGWSGTSMSSPNAAGTAALVMQEYIRLFGGAMRSSTLKGLLIHTADDLGIAGPDYSNGWGLVNGKAAADLVRDHAANPGKIRLTEGLINTSSNTITHTFTWDGASPIRATLCWTDPAGTSTNVTDSRTARLVNNLDLRVVSPNGVTNRPYVMPFVGTWTTNSMGQAATTGTNNTDNVEQVYIASPSTAGTYQAVVTYQGTLSGSQQHYSLLVSGSANPVLQSPVITSATTANVNINQPFSYQITADNFPSSFGASGLPPGLAFNAATGLISGMPTTAGTYSIALSASNAAGTGTGSLELTVRDAFAGALAGWDMSGLSNYGDSPLPPTAFATNYVEVGGLTRSAAIGTGGTAATRGWGGTTWTSTNSFASFTLTVADGYKLSLSNISVFDYRRSSTGPSAGQLQYSTNGTDFVAITNVSYSSSANGGASVGAIDLTGVSGLQNIEAPTTLTLRVVNTNANNANGSWYIYDRANSTAHDFEITGAVERLTGRPTVTAPATTSSGETEVDGGVTYQVVRTTSTTVSVSAEDDAGEGNLTYTWSVTGGSVTFTPNGTNAAKTSTATFTAAGDYTLTVTVRNAEGITATSSVPVRVKQTPTSIAVSPASASVVFGGTQSFSAQQRDQFATAMTTQPSFAWSVSGGGTISSGGLFTAGAAGGPYTVTAAANSVSGTAQVSVTKAAATVTLGNLSAVYDGTSKAASVTTTPGGLATTVTYNGLAAVPVNAGSYAVAATVTDPNYAGSASGTLVIDRAPQAITFAALPAPTFGAAPFAVSGVATSGLPVDYDSSNPAVASVAEGLITINGAGTTIITATQTGDANREPAAPVTQTLTVAKAAATVSLGNLNQTYDGEPKPVSVTTTPAGLVVDITYDNSPTVPVEIGSYAVSAAINEANYAGSATGTLLIDSNVLDFARWIANFPGLSDVSPSGDPDRDGLSNAMEYFMALDPSVRDADGAMVPGLSDQAAHLDYRRSKALNGMSGVVKWSTNPGENAGWSAASVTDEPQEDHDTWELRRATVPWTNSNQIFLRLDLIME